ncbi:proline-rich protein 2-like [Abrus precatorius]|uniref:Proline-rich protein 2-like n=1 Tax=Abrus precatorius TaxID=3816 RepID=A0A8B8LDA2_ABRPR|nr:proline-rich protein 2-like [Abrus precatorius]
MRNPSSMQCAFSRFGVPLMLLVSIFCATSALATTEVPVNTDGKVVNEELTKTNQNGHDEEAKFKGFFHPKPIFKKTIPIFKPEPKIIPIPVYKPVPKIIPIVKPIPVFKPHPKPIIVKKPIPAVETESFLKPKPFFKKPIIHKIPLHPKFEKPHIPHFPIHKPIHKPFIPTP